MLPHPHFKPLLTPAWRSSGEFGAVFVLEILLPPFLSLSSGQTEMLAVRRRDNSDIWPQTPGIVWSRIPAPKCPRKTRAAAVGDKYEIPLCHRAEGWREEAASNQSLSACCWCSVSQGSWLGSAGKMGSSVFWCKSWAPDPRNWGTAPWEGLFSLHLLSLLCWQGLSQGLAEQGRHRAQTQLCDG